MKIAIAGYGIEGKSSHHYFSSLGHEVTLLDARSSLEDLPGGVAAILGENAFNELEDFDMVIRTPSLPPSRLASARKVWSATNEFFTCCPALIIGVTGTKGKGTTSSLITAILESAGKTVHLLGNIGKPALDELATIRESDVVVYELSSFQLWDLETSPHIATVLMVEPDHLDVHVDFDEYVRAKANIATHQHENDIVIYHPTNTESAKIASYSPAKTKLRYLTSEAAYVHDGKIMIGEQLICSIGAVGLRGDYNLQNVCAAVSVCWYMTQDTAAIARAVAEFKGLEHRLEFVASRRGIDFYNDSYSSAPTATMAAITAFKTPTVLIVGGYDRGIDLTPLALKIRAQDTLKKVIVIGQIRDRLAEAFKSIGFESFVVMAEVSMQAIVASAVKNAERGDTILLSPGCASFDMFTNFSERGELFKEIVRAIDE